MVLVRSIIAWMALRCCAFAHALPWKNGKRNVLYLDVDNTLYDETQARLESQIVQNIHSLIEPMLADNLHATYGSTIAGLNATQWAGIPNRLVHHRKYYESVYHELNYKNLLAKGAGDRVNTGYDHQRVKSLTSLLKKQTNSKLYLASNSPRHHVESVLQAMGMTRVPWSGIMTPDESNHYATKLDGPAFWGKKHLDESNAVLIDDSVRNIESSSMLMKSIHCNNTDMHNSIHVALDKAFGWVEHDFAFSDVKYLKAKNEVDRGSIHKQTWERLTRELTGMPELTIVDLGAGLLSMLDLSLHGSDRLSPLWTNEQDINYYAFEPNHNLEPEILRRMEEWGFQRDVAAESSEFELVFRKGRCTVFLRFQTFEDARGTSSTPHLILGCCFADLHNPDELVPSIMEKFLADPYCPFNSTLLYFPITFLGTTQFWPPQPFEGRIPSDTLAFQLYGHALRDMGHYLDPGQLRSVVEDYGGDLLEKGPSVWNINSGVLWDTMLYFFGTSCACRFTEASWDLRGWIERARRLRPAIQASNTDLLFEIPLLGRWVFEAPASIENAREERLFQQYDEVLFTAPREVKIVRKEATSLKGDEVRIKSECSLISTGTELKVFTGEFDGAPLDVNIDSMKNERLQFPLAYGYSLVGTVVECGKNLEKEDWVGRRVFCFNAHASQAIAKASDVQMVPDDCSSFDAIFMPSVETALSLVQEARPVLGENVGVFGQGLIGLLVTALLGHFRLNGPHNFGVVTTCDKLPDRVMQSSRMHSNQALQAGTRSNVMFDVAIEVSGSGLALQSAIDQTRPGGRIVVGSWYGNADVPLRLGMDFHRSHKTLVASQVSNIPASLSGTWSKARRFQLAWELVKELRPSRLISKQLPLLDAQHAYAMLETGEELVLAFCY